MGQARVVVEDVSPKRLSCGVLVTDGVSLVMGRATGKGYWDIPKGRPGRGEPYDLAAIREMDEETGIEASSDDLVPLGRFAYRDDTDLQLFLLKVDAMPDPSALVCRSMVYGMGDPFPELDAFLVVPWDRLEEFATRNMSRSLRTAEVVMREELDRLGEPRPTKPRRYALCMDSIREAVSALGSRVRNAATGRRP